MTDSVDRVRLPRSWFERETIAVARDLLGQLIVSRLGGALTSGRIVETEAYRGSDDLASHAARHRSGRSVSMRESVGLAYIYRSYGIHAMLNVIAHGPDGTGAVLIRALEPIEGIATMSDRRGGVAEMNLCSGPGKLCVALGIGLQDHGVDLVKSDEMWVAQGASVEDEDVRVGPRIGISRALEAPWRFFEADQRHVSATRRGRRLTQVDVYAAVALPVMNGAEMHAGTRDG